MELVAFIVAAKLTLIRSVARLVFTKIKVSESEFDRITRKYAKNLQTVIVDRLVVIIFFTVVLLLLVVALVELIASHFCDFWIATETSARELRLNESRSVNLDLTDSAVFEKFSI